jgi:hypothetical protein
MSDSIKETVAKLKKIGEGHLGAMADRVELDHEVQLARGQLYKIAKYAIKLHEAFKDVSEVQGLDGWVSAKITEAAQAMDDVAHYMEYELSPANIANEEKEGTAANLLHEYNVLKEAEDDGFNLADLAPELRPAVRQAMIKFPMSKDRLSAVLRMLQQEKEKHGEYDQDIDRLDTENDVQDVDIDSTDVDLDNLVARVAKLEQPQIEPKVDEDKEWIDPDSGREWIDPDTGREWIDPDRSTGYPDSERESMQDLIDRLNVDDKMERDPFGSDFTRGLDPEFSKRVADQNRKARTSQGSIGTNTSGGLPTPESKYKDWSK